MARLLVATLFYSVDGVASDPFTFQYDSFDEELGELMTQGIARIDDVLLGRVTYEEWAQYWPGHDGPDDAYANFINAVPKHVASRTLTAEQLTWQNSALIPGDLLEHVRTLKRTTGRDIAVQGSLSVVRQLVVAGVLDELTLIVHPVVAGQGRRLFEGAVPTRLRLLRSSSTSNGNAILTYGPHR